MKIFSINGLCSTWNTVKFHGSGSAHLVPIKIDMIRAVQKSKLIYNEEQLSLRAIADLQKKQSETYDSINEEKKWLIDQEQHLLSKQRNLQAEQKKAQLLVGEGRQRLDNALKKADMLDAQATKALIGAGDE